MREDGILSNGVKYKIIYMSEVEEKEKNPHLRNLRNKLGYGEGWTFKRAFIDFISPGLGVIPLIVYILLRSIL